MIFNKKLLIFSVKRGALLPSLAFFYKKRGAINENTAQYCPQGINANVSGRCSSSHDEILMEFVGSGIQRTKEYRNQNLIPGLPGCRQKRIAEENGQYHIYKKMGTFPNKMIYCLQRLGHKVSAVDSKEPH